MVLVILGLVSRLFVIRNNNIFFTVDQGRDAVYVREILGGEIFLKGPETNIRGIFSGPLVYYFFSLGYIVAGLNPIGAPLTLIVLNTLTIALFALWIRSRVGDVPAIIIGLSLLVFWPYFETSLWGFNPFPLVVLALTLVVLLVRFLKDSGRHYYLGLVPITLSFNTELAGATALFIFYILVGLWGVKKKLISFRKYLMIVIIPPLLGGLILGRQFISRLFLREADVPGKSGAMALGTNFAEMVKEFLKIIGSTVLPQNITLGVLVFALIIYLGFIYRKSIKGDTYRFIFLTALLTLVSFIFFASNQGWRSWHTVYLPPLIFVSILLVLTKIPKQIGVIILALVVVFQLANFIDKYSDYLRPSGNPSLMYNQLAAIDWVYEKSQNQGFRVYNYTDTFYDYPYQYLFWWYGLKKYGYLPDEYSNFPLSHKGLYVPGYEKYANPKRSGEDFKFLIIESETNGEDNKNWPEKFKLYHELLDTTQVGDIVIEKYLKKHDAPNDLCIWWGECNL